MNDNLIGFIMLIGYIISVMIVNLCITGYYRTRIIKDADKGILRISSLFFPITIPCVIIIFFYFWIESKIFKKNEERN